MTAAAKFNGFLFNGPKLDDFDFPRIGHQIGVGEDVIHAVIDVEANGKSTDSKGRLKMLFEPHIFYRQLGAGAKRDKAVKAGLAYPKWKKGYPADSYPRLEQAMAIDERAAINSASWGFPQIMGFNAENAGFEDAADMIRAMQTNEDVQLQAMITFIKNVGLDDELRAIEKKVKAKQRVTEDDCRAFVRGYNGEGYEKNEYHIKFAKAVNKWMKIPDTPWSPEDITAEAVVVLPPEYKNGKYHAEVEAAQMKLDELGYHEVGSVDGKWGRKTETAILAFRLDNDLPLVPDMDAPFLAKLAIGAPRPISEARAKATVDDLRKAGSETIKAADKNEIVAYTTLGLGGVGGVTKAAEQLKSYSDPIKKIVDAIEPVKDFITDNILIILIGVGAFIIWQSIKIKRERLEEHRTAKNVAL